MALQPPRSGYAVFWPVQGWDIAHVVRCPWHLRWRPLSIGLLVPALLSPCLMLLPDSVALFAGVKLLVAVYAIGVLPGSLLVAALRPLPRLTALELLGLGTALSLVLAGLLSVISITFHLPVATIAAGLLLLCTALAVIIWRRADDGDVLTVQRTDWVIALLLVSLAFVLCLEGSSFLSGEDQIHVSVIRRLYALSQPRLDNLYLVPDMVYTYPFPGMHFFLALVSRLGDIDPLFVYHKMRFFWGPTAIILLCLIARLLLGTRGDTVVVVTGVTAVLFAWSGAFGQVGDYFWGQLMPFSHSSDVAMNVLLPAALVLALYYLRAENTRDRGVFFGFTLAAVTLLTLVHPRELVQFAVYLGSFILALLLLRFRGKRADARRTALLLGATIGIVVLYMLWHRTMVGHVGAFEAERRTEQLARIQGFSLQDWWGPSLQARHLAYGWNPLGLLAGPVVLFLFRRNLVLLLMLGMSVVAFLLIIRFPALHIPLTYFTYSEMLMTPVRNVIWFAYVGVAALIYILVINLAWVKQRTARVGLALGTAVGLAFIYQQSGRLFERHGDVLVFGVLLLYLVSFGAYRSRRGVRWARAVLPGRVPRAWSTTLLLLTVPLAVLSSVPTSVPLGLGRGDVASALRAVPSKLGMTPESLVRDLGCVRDGVALANVAACAPSHALIRWAGERLPVDAVLAANDANAHSLTTFLPQQVAAPTGVVGATVLIEPIFPTSYALFQRAREQGRRQPFFNRDDSPAERQEFLRALGVTHVVLDPASYAEMKALLEREPGQYAAVYDDGHWAVYQVTG